MSYAKLNELIIDPKVRGLCVKPYPNHKKGCPNYAKKKGCPPMCPVISETLDLSQPVYAIWNTFPIGEHVERMKAKHPDWTERQLYCCLYWQPKARKQLRQLVDEFCFAMRQSFTIVACPEAQGVNLTETMKGVGVELEWPPRINARQIVIAGKQSLRQKEADNE